MKRAPPPGAPSTLISPPWAVTIRLAIARPRPLPWGRSRRLTGNRVNGSKIRSRSASGTPPPWSLTTRTFRRATLDTATVTVPPRGECATALSTRMRMSCTSRSRSPRYLGRPARVRDDPHPALGGEGADAPRRLEHERAQVLGRRGEGELRRVRLRQGQQVSDEPAHPVGFGDDVLGECRAVRLNQALPLEHLSVRADQRHRRAQLVRGIGDEAALGIERTADGDECA